MYRFHYFSFENISNIDSIFELKAYSFHIKILIRKKNLIIFTITYIWLFSISY
jgi:hypothetical protein